MKFPKHLFALFILLTLATSFSSQTFAFEDSDADLPPVTLMQATDLHTDGAQSRQRHVPILLMFAQQGCSWCHYVEEDQLKPMLRNADYRAQVIIRQVMIDDPASIIGFDGHPTSATKLASYYNAPLTPTIVFVDETGKLLAPLIVGVRNTEFYGGDLDMGLALSVQKIRQQLAALNLNL
jgi:thioredoxin-related protein